MKLINFNLAAAMPTHQRKIFNQVGDHLNEVLHLHQFETQLDIDVAIKVFDGEGGILGQAGPECGPTVCLSRSGLPIKGVIELDADDLDVMVKNETAADVITHETLHVLGYGTLWSMYGLIKWSGGSNPQYIGENGLVEYRKLTNDESHQGVPLENTGGPGTREAHWLETLFQNELATGYISGSIRPLSRLTLASLSDLGYKVDLDLADPYELPLPKASSLMSMNVEHSRPHAKCPNILYVDDLSKAA